MIAHRVEILDVPLDCIDMQGAVDAAEVLIERRTPASIFAVNPEKVIAAQSNAELRHALKKAALLIPDGIGVVAAARILHGRSFSRVPGAELMPKLCEHAARTGRSVFLLGAAPGVADKAAVRLRQSFEGLQIAGVQHGYFDQDRIDQVKADIRTAKPDIVFVAFGSPRQELWIDAHIHDLGAVLVQAVGGTFDVIAGNVQRAPALFRDSHLEWFYRLVSDPSRIHRQRALPQFASAVVSKAIWTRMLGDKREAT